MILDDEETRLVRVTSGVPQGSVLGPIRFLIYINDLPDELASKVRLLADDKAVYLTIGGEDDSAMLQQDMDRLSVWEFQWDTAFYPSNRQVVRETNSKKTSNTRYFGVDISNGMSWNSYVARITSRANTTLDFIKRSIKTKHVRVRETAHNTLACPQLEYAAPIWDPHTKHKIFQLEKAQSCQADHQ